MGILSLILTGPFIAVLSIIFVITGSLLKIPVGILNWVVNTPVSFTHAPVVETGWAICRDFVNIFFVLALVFIALATILRIKSYSAQKNLPGLLIAAILINFTPVICGAIIDIANVIMNIFKDYALGGASFFYNNPFKAIFYPNWLDTLKVLTFDGNTGMEIIGRLLAGITFNTLSALILSAYALIFLLRIMVLWVLVIFSPFAFLGLFFPIAKGVWKGWSKQFFNWTFIGIPLFFFLSLARIIIDNPICKGIPPSGSTISNWISTPGMCSILLLVFPTFFLLIGIGVTFMIGAKGTGADKILNWGQKQAKQWGKQQEKILLVP